MNLRLAPRPPWTRLVLALALLFFPRFLPAAPASDPFAEGVRPTSWQSPADEQKAFRLPPGFEIQLVAAEPDINKPLNLAFDAAGRLWVTTSIEYPYAAPTNRPGRDRLMIFEDFGTDGRARKVTEFAGGLNIPIGIHPFFSPSPSAIRNPQSALTWKCLVWSIPNLWLFEDTDGDGKADKREVLYGPFDHTRDTHGNQASFRRGFDGWLYATHGYNNDSHVKGRDGHQVDLNSGNTYRLRLDGSRIEHHTHGQVNPFGLAFDELGNLFSSDCHSEPIYQLLAGGYYPSFGKPHDGLGFAPKMMEKPRGSTAIDAISIYSDNLWPAEFHGNILIGDVMASRVFRDRVTEEGSTRTARPMPDFVTTEDPWFRPVDTQLGPDGALYIADFYNKIIGHYEVPLAHPGRDRTSGRIWRVVKSRAGVPPARNGPWLPAEAGETPALLWPRFDFTKASAHELVVELSHPNLTRRMLAMNTLADWFGTNFPDHLRATAPGGKRHYTGDEDVLAARAHALWLFNRFEALDDGTLIAASKDLDRTPRVHAMRILAERGLQAASSPDGGAARSGLKPALRQLAVAGLDDKDALVQRCAAEALGNSPSYDNIQPLLALVRRVPAQDTHLLYVVRKALRDQLVPEENFQRLATSKLTEAETGIIADISLAVKSSAAATFLLRQLPEWSKARNPSPPIADILKHAARYAPESELDQLASFARARIPAASGVEQYQEIERQFSLFKSVDEGLQQRGRARPETLRAWGTNLVWKFFGALDGDHSWTATACEPNPTDVPWDVETRTGTDGRPRQLTSSLPHGEDLTGVLRSPDFPLPAKLTFWLCGHDGFPDQPAGNLNFIRLRLAPGRGLQAASPSAVPNGPGNAGAPGVAGSGSGVNAALPGAVLATAPAPRNDTARRITWELPEHAGQRVVVEAVDGDEGRAYAWIAFGGFEPEMSQLRPSEFSPRKRRDWFTAATEAAVRLNMKESAPIFAHFVAPQHHPTLDEADADTLASLARAWVALEPAQAIPVLAGALTTHYGPVAYREAVAGVLSAQNTPAAQAAVLAAAKSLPLKSQEKICFTLASSTFGAETLLAGIEGGAISPRVLHRVGVNTRLKSSKPNEARLKKLTAKLPPPDDVRNKLIADRRAAYSTAPGQPDTGRLIFAKQCAACHKIGKEGAVIGPQLDGIGQRGLERLCEDLLDPNRNVDGAFRSTMLMLKDGDMISGLFRREEGETIVLAENTGKEITVPKSQVIERRESDISLMPENVGEILSVEDFNHLMAFLLSQGAVSPKP